MTRKYLKAGIISFVFCLTLISLKTSSTLGSEYNAKVTTENGTYHIPVQVEGGEVTQIYWSDGPNTQVTGARIQGGRTTGTDSNGKTVHILLEGYVENSGQKTGKK